MTRDTYERPDPRRDLGREFADMAWTVGVAAAALGALAGAWCIVRVLQLVLASVPLWGIALGVSGIGLLGLLGFGLCAMADDGEVEE